MYELQICRQDFVVEDHVVEKYKIGSRLSLLSFNYKDTDTGFEVEFFMCLWLSEVLQDLQRYSIYWSPEY